MLATLILPLLVLSACGGGGDSGGGGGAACVTVTGTWILMAEENQSDEGFIVMTTQAGCNLTLDGSDVDDSGSEPELVETTVTGGLSGGSWNATVSEIRTNQVSGQEVFDGQVGTLVGTFSASVAGGTVDTFLGTLTITEDGTTMQMTVTGMPYSPAPAPTNCAAVAVGSWDFLVVAGPALSLGGGSMIQSGCDLVFTKEGFALSGVLGEDVQGLATWNPTITANGQPVGELAGTIRSSAGSPYYEYAATSGTYMGAPITIGQGEFVPGSLTIGSIDPDQGALAGGTVVEITGNGFLDEGLSVTFGDEEATILETVSNTLVRVSTPSGPGMEGPVDVSVITEAGQATQPFAFTYFTCDLTTGPWVFHFDGPGTVLHLSSTTGNLTQVGNELIYLNTDKFSGDTWTLAGTLADSCAWSATVRRDDGVQNELVGSIEGYYTSFGLSFEGTGTLDLGSGPVSGTWNGGSTR